MGNFKVLFTISVEHRFYKDDLCRNLLFIPDDKTDKLSRNTDLIVKKNLNGITVLWDEEKAEAIRLYGDDPDDPFELCFKVYSKDMFFLNHTSLPYIEDGSILFFDSRKSVKRDSVISLHSDEFVSEKDVHKINSKPLKIILTEKEKRIKPAFIVRISPSIDNLKDSSRNTEKYLIRFKARSTYWRYYLTGNIEVPDKFIEDFERKVKFTKPEDIVLENGKRGLFFQTKSQIFLKEFSEKNFQLKTGKQGNCKTIIKRLPAASPDSVFKENDNKGEKRYISEIFINL